MSNEIRVPVARGNCMPKRDGKKNYWSIPKEIDPEGRKVYYTPGIAGVVVTLSHRDGIHELLVNTSNGEVRKVKK